MPSHHLVTALIAATVLAAPAAAQARSDFQQLTIGITPVRGDDPTVCDAIYNAFRNRVIALQRFTVIERDDARIGSLIREGALAASGLAQTGSGPQIGQLLGAGYLAFLEYDQLTVNFAPPKKRHETGQYRASLRATARFVDTETGIAQKAFAATGSGSHASWRGAVQQAVDNLVDDMLLATREVFALQATILQRDEREVIINLGRRQGLIPGTRFSVQRAQNGVRRSIGQVVVTAVDADRAAARITDGYWTIQAGDMLTEAPRAGGTITAGATYEYVPVSASVNPAAPSGQFAAQTAPGHLVGAQVSAPDLVGDGAGLSGRIGYLGTGGTSLSGLLIDLVGIYRIDVVPERVALHVHAGPSLMTVWQAKGNYLGADLAINRVTGSNLDGWGFGLTTGLDAVVTLGRHVQLTGGIGYRLTSTIGEWSGSFGEDRPNYRFPGSEMAYPTVGINGLVFRGGLNASF